MQVVESDDENWQSQASDIGSPVFDTSRSSAATPITNNLDDNEAEQFSHEKHIKVKYLEVLFIAHCIYDDGK